MATDLSLIGCEHNHREPNDLSIIISNISNIIKSTSQETPHIIFMSLGSAAATRNLNGLVDDENYHQYPQFLQNINHKIRGGHIHIILIDPELESPPYIIQDHSKGLDFENITGNYYIAHNFNHVHVYTLRKFVFVNDGQFNYPDYINITDDLIALNNLCMEESILLIYNDFSGRANKSVAELYDEQICMHLDHIVYGLSSRKQISCYINLLEVDAQFAFKIVKQNRLMIKVFNIYTYLIGKENYNINNIIDEYGIENIDIISSHISCALQNYIEEFKNYSLSVLRCLYNLKKDKININISISANNITINKDKQKQINNLLNTKKYDELYEYVFNIFAFNLDYICKLKDNGLTGYNMLKAITNNDDPFKWYNELRYYF